MTMDREPNDYNSTARVYDRETRGSNTLAYLIGGLVVALGLLAFLFYDGGSRDVSTTGSVSAPQSQSAPSLPATAPATSPAPAAPMSPGSPTAPAAPQ